MPPRRIDHLRADLNPQALAVLQQAGAKQTAPSARDFATELDAVLLLVVNAAQVKQILFGEQGLAPKLRPGTAVMVSSTISADDAKQIQQRLLDYGLPMLDAPVSGGAAKAEEGQMTVMAAGTDATFERLQPVLDAIAGKVYRIGETIGLGATVKSSTSCWLACTSPPARKRWRWPPALASRWT